MCRLILPSIILLFLSACNPWQYLTVSSPQLTHNGNNQLVFENDTLRLTYDIGGQNGEVSLRILNKTSQPLTVKWQRSAFIRNQQSIGFLNQDVVIHGHTIHSSRYTRNFIASFMLPDSVGFVPPNSEISNDLPTLASTGPLQIDLLDSPQQKRLAHTNGIDFVNYRQLHYDEVNSPIRFTSYLTFSIGHDNKEFSLTNRFYVSEIYVTDGRPESFSLYHGHGDQIYIHQKATNPSVTTDPPIVSSNIR